MKLPQHAAASLAVSAALYAAVRSPALAVSSFAAGVLVDLDHIHDYLREYGPSIDLAEFFRVCHGRQFEKGVLVLHGWEWLVVLAAGAWLMQWNPWLLGALVGLGHHLVLDQMTNGVSRWGYSLLWRWRHQFAFDRTFPRHKRLDSD